MKDKKKISGLYRQMLLITILPLICMGVVIMAFFYKGFEASMQKEVKNEMKNMAFSIEEAYDSIYPGDYRLVGENYLAVVKGESVLKLVMDDVSEMNMTLRFDGGTSWQPQEAR